MSDELYPYYERELEILRDLAAEFAASHPKAANRLAMGRGDSQDPHVERLVQAFAFLAARVHHRLDDDFPELTTALIDVLYPHYLQPVPSMATIQLAFDPQQAAVTEPYHVPRGTEIETERVNGEPCTYRTCFDVDLLPLRIADVTFAGPPFRVPVQPPSGTEAVFQVTLETLSEAVGICDVPIERLRFHLHAASGRTAYDLHELLLTRASKVVVWPGQSAGKENLHVLPKDSLQAAGYDAAEAALGVDSRSFPGYRLLSEFFAFPQKFLYVDLTGITREMTRACGRRLEIAVFIKATGGRGSELMRSVSRETVRLGCTPIVNAFELRLDPVKFDGRSSEECIIPDTRRRQALEIHSLTEVRGREQGADARESTIIKPFMAKAAGDGRQDAIASELFWRVARRPRVVWPEGPQDMGERRRIFEHWISLVDVAGSPKLTADKTITLHIKAICGNGNLPEQLPGGLGRPELHLRDGQGPIGTVECLIPPTRTLRPEPGKPSAWRLISHLALNHLSLLDVVSDKKAESGAAGALQELLRLYLLKDLDHFEQKQRWVEGIRSVKGRPVTARVPGARGGFCRGLEVRVEFDDGFEDGAGYLFASILERFLGAWVSVNSFTRLVATSRRRESRKEEWRWPARAGNRVLV